jgi:hypothetical protein
VAVDLRGGIEAMEIGELKGRSVRCPVIDGVPFDPIKRTKCVSSPPSPSSPLGRG